MNYIGSKLSLLPFLDECITTVIRDKSFSEVSFCDLFAGTGAVGRHFKQKGCRIISNDLQYYSYVLNQQYIGNHHWMAFSGLENELDGLSVLPVDIHRQAYVCDHLDRLTLRKGFIYHNYSQGDLSENDSRLYFSRSNAMKCDAIRSKIAEWHNRGQITDGENYFLLASLLENVDKVANTASVYGAYLKTLKKSAQKLFKLQPVETIVNSCIHEVYNRNANELIREISCDVLYLDPPYNQRQYSANYHLLETIARYDSPKITGKTGMRDYSAQKSLYCSRREVVKAFSDLMENAKTKYVFLSYNNEGLLSFDEIQEIMSQYGEYGCFERKYDRFKADKASYHRNIKAKHTTEYLHYVVIPQTDK